MPGARGAGKIQRPIRAVAYIILSIFFLDQLSKIFLDKLTREGSSIPVLEGVFYISRVHNTGAAFGIFKGFPCLFVIIGVFAVITIGVILARKIYSLTTVEVVGVSFLLGGTLGNLADRLRLGYVVDFLDFRVWPVFNIADSFITVGAILLVLGLFSGHKKIK